jgi:signal transduction histidine kinase
LDEVFVGQSQSFASTPTILKIDNRVTALMRFVWAFSALVIIYIDPTEPNKHVFLTYVALILYVSYSASLCFSGLQTNKSFQWISSWSHWIDVCWFTVMIGLSSGTNTIFFFGFFFSILVASFRWGFTSGLTVTIVSVVIVTVIGLVTRPTGPTLDMYRVLLRPVNLFVLGYLMAYRGGRESILKGQLKLLKEVTTLSNPRFGIDHTVGSAIERLRAFYNADKALLVVRDQSTGKFRLHKASIGRPEEATKAQVIAPDLADLMLSLPSRWAAVYGTKRTLSHPRSHITIYNTENGERIKTIPKSLEAIAGTLDATGFVTVPLSYHNDAVGRLFLVTSAKRHFDISDVEFLLQVIEQIAPVIDNIRLVDRLASDAAEQERQRIARDIHDAVIQPYIGLQIGLEALKRKVNSDSGDIEGAVDRLIELTAFGVKDLRQYVYGLKESGDREISLIPAIRRYATKFAETTGISVDVDVSPEIWINDRLAAEVFHMAVEGLSNVRRHTEAIWAGIGLECADGHLQLKIENDGNGNGHREKFMPHSLSQRTNALGGKISVEGRQQGGTVVSIEIPL